MIKIIILKREGEMEQLEIENSQIQELNLEKILKINDLEINELMCYKFETYCLKIFGCDNKYLLKENKHEFLPPFDNKIYFGDLILLKIIDNKFIDNLTLDEYKKLLEK